MDPCGSPSTLPLLWLLIGSRSCYSGQQLLRDYAARELNAFLWISLIAVTLFLLSKVARLFRLWSEGSKSPGLFVLPSMATATSFSCENFSEVLSGLHDKYGSIFKLWLGPRPTVWHLDELASLHPLIWSKNRALHLNNQKLSANLGGGVKAACGGLACSSVMMSGSFIADEKCSHIFLNEEHSANMMGIMFHSYLTTAGLICNVLATLAKHPEIQDQIYSEIFMARKGSLKEDKQNADHMVLLAATVYESARLLPAWTLLQRCSLENAGAGLIVPVQLVQMDSSSWGKDASEFNPCRFISTVKGESDSSNTTGEAGLLRTRPFVLNDPNESAAFLPFGSGAHACVGQKFVIQAVVLLVASLLEQYEMKLKPGSDTNLKPSTNNSVLQLFLSLELVFIKRSN